MKKEKKSVLIVSTRVALGLIFLWAFFDKLIGLGFATPLGNGWIAGSSPTTYFLANVVYGPLASFYNMLAGSLIIDFLFMASLLGIGLSLLTGLYLKQGCISGAILMLLMWSSLLPPKNNPLIDEHIIYALVMLLIAHLSKEK